MQLYTAWYKMGCSPPGAVLTPEQVEEEAEEESNATQEAFIEREERCNSELNKENQLLSFRDDTAKYDRGGDLRKVEVCAENCCFVYGSASGEQIMRNFVEGEQIPFKIVQDGRVFKKLARRKPETFVSEDEDYYNYDTNRLIKKHCTRELVRELAIVDNGVVYSRRPRTYEYENNVRIDRSLSEEYIADDGHVIRRHFRRGEILPANIVSETSAEADICETIVFRRLRSELCTEDCDIEYMDYEHEHSMVEEYARGEIISKLMLVQHDNVVHRYFRRIPPRSDSPSESFSEEFVDEAGTVMRKHFAKGEERLSEVVVYVANALAGIQKRVFCRRGLELEESVEQPEELNSQQSDELDFAELVQMDYAQEFEGKTEPPRKYDEYHAHSDELAILSVYNSIAPPVTCEKLFNMYDVDAFKAKQMLREAGNFDSMNVTFWQFERFIGSLGETVGNARPALGKDLIELDLLE